ncbi:uncharacterized protein LOC144360501, partial [Saccoglossus kowalevskii]
MVNTVLMVGSHWWPRDNLTLSLNQREGAVLLASNGHGVICTMTDPSNDEMVDARNNNVQPLTPQAELSGMEPDQEWLKIFPMVKHYHKDVKIVFGHVGTTAEAALSIKEKVFPDAKYVPIIHSIQDLESTPSSHSVMQSAVTVLCRTLPYFAVLCHYFAVLCHYFVTTLPYFVTTLSLLCYTLPLLYRTVPLLCHYFAVLCSTLPYFAVLC